MHSPYINAVIQDYDQRKFYLVWQKGQPLENCYMQIFASNLSQAELLVDHVKLPPMAFVIREKPEGNYRLRTYKYLGLGSWDCEHHLLGLSLKQPYADYIMLGKKTIETRKWETQYRGDLLVCSSGYGKKQPLVIERDEATGQPLRTNGFGLCIIRLFSIKPMMQSDEEEACCPVYARAKSWRFDNLRQIKPIPMKGALGLWVPEFTQPFRLLN